MAVICETQAKDRIVYGVEVEVEVRGGYTGYQYNNLRDLGLFDLQSKYDGSLDTYDGREFTLGPADFRTHKRLWKKFFEYYGDGLRNSYRCGMHVHVNRAFLDTVATTMWRNPHPAELIWDLIHDNEFLFEKLADRNCGEYARFTDGGYDPRSYKYLAVTTYRPETVEFRLFASPKDFETFMGYMEVVKSVVVFCTTERDSYDVDSYVRFVESKTKLFPHLNNKLKALGI